MTRFMRLSVPAFGFLVFSLSAASAQSLTAGTYACSGAGNTFRITIRNASQYVDRAGNPGTYAIAGARITFASGSLAGQYSELLGPGKFGLSSGQTRTFYVVCNLT